MFVPGSDAILIGIQDQRDIAARVISQWPVELTEIYIQSNHGRRPSPQQLLDFALKAAIRRCMAHEIGHALLHAGYPNPFAPDEEAGADYYAGKFDAARNLRQDLGEMFFFSIGCVGPTCDHPAPHARAHAYRAGYEDQKRAA